MKMQDSHLTWTAVNFLGLYKPAQIDPRQDLTATPTRVNSSGFGLSSPAPKKLMERGLELCTRCCPVLHAQTLGSR